MKYKSFQDMSLSALGFGTMRLPTLPDGSINEPVLQQMVDLALAEGVNYFDTAYPYHNGQSEPAVGRALARYPRESFYLATKYPGHQYAEEYDPAEVFEDQLRRCGVEYFDFYLLHNVCESTMDVYMSEKWGIVDYFLEQKRLGRIRHLGFSCHALPDGLERFLQYAGGKMEFCQIQLNYLDWTLQDARTKCEILDRYNIPVWVMEPVRGGRLARLTDAEEARLRAVRPEESPAAWCFRWLQSKQDVTMVLSGMSSPEQMKENIATFSHGEPLNAEECALLEELAEGMKNALPCTACRYCCEGCPQELDIPMLIAAYNDMKFESGTTIPMLMDSIPEEKRPAACVNCGQCAETCPQKIDVPAVMAELADMLAKGPSWAEISRQRNEIARKLREQQV